VVTGYMFWWAQPMEIAAVSIRLARIFVCMLLGLI
jgi:hypothetical protein